MKIYNSENLKELGKDLHDLYPKLANFVKKYTADFNNADDIVMEVITNLIKKAKQDGLNIHLESYAMTAVKYKSIDYLRYKKRFPEIHSTEEEGGYLENIEDTRAERKSFNLSKAKVSGIEEGDLGKALGKLGAKCFNILTAFGIGHSYKQISEKLDIASGTVMSRLHRCREQLKHELEKL